MILRVLLYAGTSELDDIIIRRRVIRANAYTFFMCLSMFIVVVSNIFLKNYIVSLIVFPNLVIILLNFIFFKKKKNYESYPDFLSLIFLYIMLSANIFGGLRGFGPYLIDIFILLTSSLMVRKKAVVCWLILLGGNLCAYFLGNDTNIIFNYREVVPIDVFIKFTTVHIGVAVVGYINNKNLQKGYLELEFEKNKSKQLFLNLVHDLKTPLTILDNKIDLTIIKNQGNEDLVSLKRTINDMSHNIVSIIDLEKKTKKQQIGNLHSINISDESKKIIESYKSLVEDSNCSLKYKIEESLYIKCSRLDYRKILTNLLDNSLKYNSENGVIYVSIYLSYNKVILSVRDQGIGIDEVDLNRIFDPYTQLDRGIRSKYGLGLGLSIVKTICNEIGALIEVKSKKLHGSTFSINFDLSNEIQEKKSVIHGEYSCKTSMDSLGLRLNKHTLLIVDDHYEIRTLLYETLITDYNIILAKDGEEAMYKLNSNIDLIITDVMMPKLDGISFVKNINSLKVPVIFISAKSVRSQIFEGLNTGAIDYISKPFQIQELKLKIKSILKLMENDRNDVINKITENLTNCISNYEHVKAIPQNKSTSVLTNKEQEIIDYLLEGLSQKDIAVKMNLSINTVKSHIQRIYKKFNVHNVTALLSKI